jgi:hypothetical protein
MPDRDWNDRFYEGEMYYHPVNYELIRVMKKIDFDRWYKLSIKMLWSYLDEGDEGDVRTIDLPSRYTEQLWTYDDRTKLAIMRRIFE